MRQNSSFCVLLIVLLFGSLYPEALSQTSTFTYPAAAWEKADIKNLGWSESKLQDARHFYDTLPPASVFIVDRGRAVAQWGNPAMRVKLSSARKSLLSALYGIYLGEGRLNLDKTLAELGVDDDPPLSPEEKQATVKMVIEARSGVYHSFVAGTPAMRAAMPKRGSHPPGSFWYYNNWDFNVLGSIFEQQTQAKIGVAFRDRIAAPLQMQDFRLEDMYYLRASSSNDPDGQSIHPAYHFRLSARDMARFGYLFLRQGNWNGRTVVPAQWVKESTTSYSTPAAGEGYGYMWWVDGFDLPVKSYSAQGALAKYIVVIPERDLVVVYQNHTALPDNAQSLSDAEVKKLPTISRSQMSTLLNLILSAQQDEHR
jgi:CubicO group peptidase (beta-lactamase class C family)